MKKYFALPLLFIGLIACDDDNKDDQNDGSYPTDNLSLTADKRAVAFFSYNPNSSAMASYEQFRLMAESHFSGDLDFMTFVSDGSSLLYSEASDSLSTELSLVSPPQFMINKTPVDLSNVFSELEMVTTDPRKPIASISHKVTRTDSAWIVDNKIKFWKDTLAEDFFVETYFLANVPAINYSSAGMDLRHPAVQNLIEHKDSLATWAKDVESVIDSGEVVVKAGTTYEHPYILIDSYTENSIYGTRISEYSPFEFFFSANDVIGTRYTPIRHYFYRPGFDDDIYSNMTYDFEPAFISIIWSKNVKTGEVDFINSYMSTSSK